MNIQEEMDRIFKVQQDSLENERKFKELGRDFINFQDDFYNLLEKYGVDSIDIEHQEFNKICNLRNKVFDFIEKPKKYKAIKLIKKKALWNSGIVLARKDSIINNAKN